MPTMKQEVEYFRLLSIRGRLKLESKGMRNSGGATRPKVAAEFGLKPRDSFEKFISAVQAKLDEKLKEARSEVPDAEH